MLAEAKRSCKRNHLRPRQSRTHWCHAPHTVKETIKMILSDIADMSHVRRKQPGPKGPAMMIKTSMSFCRWQGASKCMTCRSSEVSVSNTMSSADFRWWKAYMIMPTLWRAIALYLYVHVCIYIFTHCTVWRAIVWHCIFASMSWWHVHGSSIASHGFW